MTRAPFFISFFLASAAFAQQYVISTFAGGVPPQTPALANTISIGDPPKVAVDSAGNVYFGSLHSVFKVDATGTLTRIAGNGRPGNTDGPATSAQLLSPNGIAVDPQGTVFVADRAAHVIRRIAGGVMTTYAGTGTAGFLGDGGAATKALLNNPSGLALDTSGNLYVADSGNNCVRKIAPNGIIATFAGSAAIGPAYSGDGGPAANALLSGPSGVATDTLGNVYIADTFNNRIRRVTSDGAIGTIAGTGAPGPAGNDSQPATSAALFLPTDVAAGLSGAVYIADFGNSLVRLVLNGTLSPAAGNVNGIPPVDGQSATSVMLNGPTGVAADTKGNLYFAEGSIGTGSGLAGGDFRIWQVGPDGLFHAFAGNGWNSFSGDGQPASIAQFNVPAGMAFDGVGNLYVADSGNHRVRKIGADGTVITVAGTGIPGFSGDGGPAVAAQLHTPLAVAVGADGGVFIADSANNLIREILPDGTIGTYAGNGNAGFYGEGGLPLLAALHMPCALAMDGSNNLYIADCLDFRVRKIAGGLITTIAGNGIQAPACTAAAAGIVCQGDGGPAVNAPLGYPAGLALDRAGNVYIADAGTGQVRRVTPTGIVSTLPGGTGPGSNGQLSGIRGVAADTAGNVYVADAVGNQLWQISPGGLVTIVAGTGSCCYSGDGGPASQAQLNQPWDLLADAAGNLYVADAGNNAIRLLKPSSGLPSISAVLNVASNQLGGGLAPGEIVAVKGAGIGPAQPVSNQAASGAFGTQAGGTSVLFNGAPGPIVYASSGQVNAIVPYDISGGSVRVVVQYQGAATEAVTVPLVATAPALFTASSTGTGQAAAINQDNAYNSTAHPAPPGTFISLYATGEGQTFPAGIDGKLAPNPAPMPLLPVTVTIGGQSVTPQYAGGAPRPHRRLDANQRPDPHRDTARPGRARDDIGRRRPFPIRRNHRRRPELRDHPWGGTPVPRATPWSPIRR